MQLVRRLLAERTLASVLGAWLCCWRCTFSQQRSFLVCNNFVFAGCGPHSFRSHTHTLTCLMVLAHLLGWVCVRWRVFVLEL